MPLAIFSSAMPALVATAEHSSAAAPVADIVPFGPGSPGILASTAQSLTISLDTTQLFAGAQLMIDALSAPYMLIAGLGLGVSILSAIMTAVSRVRL